MENIIDTISTAAENLQSGSPATRRKAVIIVVGVVVGAILTALGLYEQLYSSAYSKAKDTVFNEMSAPGGAISLAKEGLASKTSELALKTSQLETEQNARKALEDQLSTFAEVPNTEHARNLEALRSSLLTSEDRISTFEDQLQSLLNERSKLVDQLAIREGKITEINAEVDRWKKTNAEAETKIVALQAELKRARDATTDDVALAETDTAPNEILVPGSTSEVDQTPKPARKQNCITSGDEIEIFVGQFFDQCESGALVVLTRRYYAGPAPFVELTVNGGEEKLILGRKVALGKGCELSLLKLTNDANEEIARMRVKCS